MYFEPVNLVLHGGSEFIRRMRFWKVVRPMLIARGVDEELVRSVAHPTVGFEAGVRPAWRAIGKDPRILEGAMGTGSVGTRLCLMLGVGIAGIAAVVGGSYANENQEPLAWAWLAAPVIAVLVRRWWLARRGMYESWGGLIEAADRIVLRKPKYEYGTEAWLAGYAQRELGMLPRELPGWDPITTRYAWAPLVYGPSPKLFEIYEHARQRRHLSAANEQEFREVAEKARLVMARRVHWVPTPANLLPPSRRIGS